MSINRKYIYNEMTINENMRKLKRLCINRNMCKMDMTK